MLQADGIDVHGPLPADTAFFLAGRGDYDLIVAMYHDQGHGPVKVLGIEAGVNITVGLPVIRTSVDHGTAFDIAGKGIAEAGSMVEALRQAAELATSTCVSVRLRGGAMPVRESQARRARSSRLARTSGLASVDDLAAQFGVTASTIRRDLSSSPPRCDCADLRRGDRPHPHPESSLRQRAMEGFDAKRAIAEWAAEQVRPGETILLDAGTTVGAMGEFLRDMTNRDRDRAG